MSMIDEKWKLLFDKYDIEKKVSENGLFYITADQIRQFKEPRLMTKFDTRESLPSVFHSRLGILPVTRGTYVIGEFDLYEDFPERSAPITAMEGVRVPDYLETVDLNDIRSEAGAINVMSIAGILEDFLGGEALCQTVSGRMASGVFSFQVHSRDCRKRHRISVTNSQVEIDGGFEGRESFVILEGKNVVHSNFLVRQLYYPCRLWSEKIKKQVRPVFMVYSNQIFRLLEYQFTDMDIYHSIRLYRERSYSLEDTRISEAALGEVWRWTEVKPEPPVPFIQADSFEKVISLAEHLEEGPMTTAEIARLFGFRERQSDYYFNACRYLGLAEKKEKVHLTEEGFHLLKLPYKKRQLKYAGLILEHQIFHELFGLYLQSGQLPDRAFAAGRMRALGLCSEALLERRSSSVAGWLRWIANLSQSGA